MAVAIWAQPDHDPAIRPDGRHRTDFLQPLPVALAAAGVLSRNQCRRDQPAVAPAALRCRISASHRQLSIYRAAIPPHALRQGAHGSFRCHGEHHAFAVSLRYCIAARPAQGSRSISLATQAQKGFATIGCAIRGKRPRCRSARTLQGPRWLFGATPWPMPGARPCRHRLSTCPMILSAIAGLDARSDASRRLHMPGFQYGGHAPYRRTANSCDRRPLATHGQPAAALRRTLEAVSAKVRHVVLIGPTPELRDTVPRCIRKRAETECALPRATFDRRAAPILASLREAADGLQNVTVVDVTDYFCTVTACPPVKDGIPLYWDSHHPTATAARQARTFEPWLV